MIEVLRSTNNTVQPKPNSIQQTCATLQSKIKTQNVKRRQKVEPLNDVDYVFRNTHSFQGESQLYIFFEDNEAVIKMIIKGRSPTVRRMSRTHRVALDLLFDMINWAPKIQIKYVDTKNQLADMLTKESLSLSSFVQHCEFLDVFCSHFSDSLSDDQVREQSAMFKNGQEATSNEGSPMAKPRPAIPAKARPTNLWKILSRI